MQYCEQWISFNIKETERGGGQEGKPAYQQIYRDLSKMGMSVDMQMKFCQFCPQEQTLTENITAFILPTKVLHLYVILLALHHGAI